MKKSQKKIFYSLAILLMLFIPFAYFTGVKVNSAYCPPKNVSISYGSRKPKTYGSAFSTRVDLTTSFKYLNRCGRKDYAAPKVISYGWGPSHGYNLTRDYGAYGYAARVFRVHDGRDYYKIRVTHNGSYTGKWTAKNYEFFGKWY